MYLPHWLTLVKVDRPALIGLLSSAILYVTSLFLPAFQPMVDGHVYTGWMAFSIVDAVFRSPLYVVWWWGPNPLIWAALWLATKARWGWAFLAGFVAMFLGLSISFDPDSFRFCIGGAFRIGYYCWLASMGLVTGTAALGLLRTFSERRTARYHTV